MVLSLSHFYSTFMYSITVSLSRLCDILCVRVSAQKGSTVESTRTHKSTAHRIPGFDPIRYFHMDNIEHFLHFMIFGKMCEKRVFFSDSLLSLGDLP